MRKTKELLIEMDKLLDLLIDNATKLLQISKQEKSDDELESLQKEQDLLLERYISKDNALNQIKSAVYFPFMQKQIDKKLDQFQQLNASFIENMTARQNMMGDQEV